MPLINYKKNKVFNEYKYYYIVIYLKLLKITALFCVVFSTFPSDIATDANTNKNELHFIFRSGFVDKKLNKSCYLSVVKNV